MKRIFVFGAILMCSYSIIYGQVPQSIDFLPIASKKCYNSPFLLTATATSRLPVSFKAELGKVNISGNLLTITGTGSVVIVASQQGDAVFEPAPEIRQSFNVEIPYDINLFPTSFTPKINWCLGDTLVETMKTIAGISYQWKTPDSKLISGPILNIPATTSSNTGFYMLTLFEGNCIFAEINFREIIHPRPIPTITFLPDSIFTDDSPVTVLATPAGGLFSGKNIQTNGIYTPSSAKLGIDSVFYRVMNKYGCEGKTYKTTVLAARKEIGLDSSIVVYELVTANDDSKNDYFSIENINKYPNHELSIFDRWGQRLFYSTKYDNKWDGVGLPEGGYYYVLKIKSPEKLYSGGFYLTR